MPCTAKQNCSGAPRTRQSTNPSKGVANGYGSRRQHYNVTSPLRPISHHNSRPARACVPEQTAHEGTACEPSQKDRLCVANLWAGVGRTHHRGVAATTVFMGVCFGHSALIGIENVQPINPGGEPSRGWCSSACAKTQCRSATYPDQLYPTSLTRERPQSGAPATKQRRETSPTAKRT